MAILNTAFLTSKISDGSSEPVEVENKSNIHRANNVDNDITIKKTTAKNWVIPKEQITITTTLTNNTDTNLTQLKIKDTVSNGAQFVSGSMMIGSEKYDMYNPIEGFTLPVEIGGFGAEMVITYDILVDEYTIVNNITNTTKINLTLDNKTFEIQSNELGLKIMDNDVTLLKSANTNAVKLGDTITYSVQISNSGTLTNTNLFFSDPIPDGTTFVENSVKIDGEEQQGFNPATGFSLKDLAPNETIIVEFKVTVN